MSNINFVNSIRAVFDNHTNAHRDDSHVLLQYQLAKQGADVFKHLVTDAYKEMVEFLQLKDDIKDIRDTTVEQELGQVSQAYTGGEYSLFIETKRAPVRLDNKRFMNRLVRDGRYTQAELDTMIAECSKQVTPSTTFSVVSTGAAVIHPSLQDVSAQNVG